MHTITPISHTIMLNAAAVTVKDISGEKGELVSVPAVIAGNPGFAGFTFEVNCPKALEW